MMHRDEPPFHIHVLHRHIPTWIALLVLLAAAAAAGLTFFSYEREAAQIVELAIPPRERERTVFAYGSWPVLQNAEFFKEVKQGFVAQRASFIEADLSKMTLRVYKEGVLAKEVPIVSKGKEGSWWETPAGVYKIEGKEEKHFSSFGRVYMPWSMPFQGNFFIHGWPYYPDGRPVSSEYSGGCIRLSSEDAKEVFRLAETGMPHLVYEDSFSNKSEDGDALTYALKKPLAGPASYLAADLENNFVFAENVPGEERAVASLTKLMTALIAVEYINVEREVTIDSSMIVKTSIPRLRPGIRASVLDLLSLLLMESSNEAALAVAGPVGESRFVDLMNQKAGAIGMKESRFADTSGTQAANVSTAEDLFALAKYLYYNRSFVLHMSVGNENRVAYGPSQFRDLANLNAIPGTAEMMGGKMGLSTATGDSMLAIFEIELGGEKRPVVVIVLGSDDSKRDAKALVRYIQSNYAATRRETEKISEDL